MASNTRALALSTLDRERAALEEQASWLEILDVQEPELASALPVSLGDRRADVAARMRRSAQTLIRTSPNIAACTRTSVLGGLLTIAQYGLEIAPWPMDQAYLVPFRVNVNRGKKDASGNWLPEMWVNQAQMIVGYKGIKALAERSPDVVSIKARPVYRGERFEFTYGASETLVHSFDIFSDTDAELSDADIVGAYMVADLRDGGQPFVHVMRISEILKRRASSKGALDADGKPKAGNPWTEWFPEMVRKTPVRTAAPFLPLSVDVGYALGVDESVATWNLGDTREPVVRSAHDDEPQLLDVETAAVRLLPAPGVEPETEAQESEPVETEAPQGASVAVSEPVDSTGWMNHLGQYSKDDLIAEYGNTISGGIPAANRMRKVDLIKAIADVLAQSSEPVPAST